MRGIDMKTVILSLLVLLVCGAASAELTNDMPFCVLEADWNARTTNDEAKVTEFFLRFNDGTPFDIATTNGLVRWRKIADTNTIWLVGNFARSQLTGQPGKEDITQAKTDEFLATLSFTNVYAQGAASARGWLAAVHGLERVPPPPMPWE